MRNISFFLTTPQFCAQTKDVTRRLGWWTVKPGDILMAVVKGQGLKKGETIQRLGRIRIVKARPEALHSIKFHPHRSPHGYRSEVWREGFPNLTADQFIEMFCRHNPGCYRWTAVMRIQFAYLEAPYVGAVSTAPPAIPHIPNLNPSMP